MANEDHVHIALPKLYGAPAYARPQVVPVQPAERPFDPDALPIEASRTEEDRELAQQVAAGRDEAGSGPALDPARRTRPQLLRGRPFRLAAITGRRRDDGNGAGA